MEFTIEYVSPGRHLIRSVPSNEIWEVSINDDNLSVVKNNVLRSYIVTGVQPGSRGFSIRLGDYGSGREYEGWKSGFIFHKYTVVADDVVYMIKQRWAALHLFKNDIKAGVVDSSAVPLKVSLMNKELGEEIDVEMMLSLILYYYWDFYVVPGGD